MKKSTIITAFFLGYTGMSFAQNGTVETDVRERIILGAKIGANYSNVYDTQGETFNADPKIGLATGISLAIPLGKYLGIQPELLFSQKGFESTGTILGSPYSVTRTTNYLDIPLLFALKPSEFISIVAGPQYSYLLSQKNVFVNGTTSIEQEKAFDNDNVRKNTFGFTGGIDISIKHFVLGARAGWDIQNNNGDGSTSTLRYKNMWYQATLGYRFYKS